MSDFVKTWKVGEKFNHENGDYCKIMAISDGYIMARKPRCAPFVVSFKTAEEWWKKWNIK